MELDIKALDMLPQRTENHLYPCAYTCEYDGGVRVTCVISVHP